MISTAAKNRIENAVAQHHTLYLKLSGGDFNEVTLSDFEKHPKYPDQYICRVYSKQYPDLSFIPLCTDDGTYSLFIKDSEGNYHNLCKEETP